MVNNIFLKSFLLGIGDILLEKSLQLKQQQKQDPKLPVVTPARPIKTQLGFEINSPNKQSPSSSGRNSPDEELKQGRNREAIRNAREIYEKERGNGKEQIHLVLIGHVDAGKSTLAGMLMFFSFQLNS